MYKKQKREKHPGETEKILSLTRTFTIVNKRPYSYQKETVHSFWRMVGSLVSLLWHRERNGHITAAAA
jgi:hypothetical protein